MIARLVGALGLLDVLLSVGGQSFVAPFFTAPQGQCCVSSLFECRGWASWWAQTQVRGDDAVVVEGRRQSVDALSPFSAPSFSLWVVVGVFCLDFRGMALMGRISARWKKKTV